MIVAIVLALLTLGVASLGVACQPARLVEREPPRGQVFRVNLLAEVGYAPLLLMRESRLLERRVPGLSVEWKTIPTREAVHEALAFGGLDVATGPPSAFLLARARGVPARALAGVSELSAALLTSRPDVRSLRDLRPDDRVALPALEGQEHLLVRMAALRDLGDWRALDSRVVVRPRLDETPSRDVAVWVAATPFLERDLETPGVRRLGVEPDSREPGSTIIAYSTLALRDQQLALFAAFVDALGEATEAARRDPDATARLLTEREGLPLPAATLSRALRHPEARFSSRISGLERLATFMQHIGQIDRAPSTQELTFAGVEAS